MHVIAGAVKARAQTSQRKTRQPAAQDYVAATRPNVTERGSDMPVLTRLYDHGEDAKRVVHALEEAGFGHEDLSIVANHASGGQTVNAGHTKHAEVAEDAAAGATAGTIFGGGVGLMAALGSLAIPGIGPVIGAGWLVSAITGAGVGAVVGVGAGGLVGALIESGVPEQDADTYVEGIRRGGCLVTAKVDDKRVAEAHRIMSARGFVDPVQRRAAYAKEGWTRFDPAGSPYTQA
jgi:uncharacterized membrane protein